MLTWNKYIIRVAGLSALVLFVAVITTSCGSEGGDLSGTTDALPGVVSTIMTKTTVMTGTQEVPAVATMGSGNAVLSVDVTTGLLSGTVSFSALSSPATAAHIHQGLAGVNGPIIIPLMGGLGLTTGTWAVPPGTVLSGAQLTALRMGGLYVQIHSQLFPAGEIRGQL